MAYSKNSFSIGDIIKVAGNGPAAETGAIVFMGENFLTYRGPYYNKTLSAFDITSGKVTITVTNHFDDIKDAIEDVDQTDKQESFTSGWITPSIYATSPVSEDPEEEQE